MNRRSFVGLSCAAGLDLMLNPVNAFSQVVQTAAVDIDQILLATQLQKCNSWCWAACLSTVFSFYNHPIDQVEIVQNRFGGNIPCLGDPTATAVVKYLNGTWTDDNGKRFTSKITASYDYNRSIFNMNNKDLIDTLKGGDPLFYGSVQHAMVICGADYFMVPGSPIPNVVRVKVVDPFPSAPRVHYLNNAEMIPRNLGGQMILCASVEIT